jgi:hypothetical protein
MHNIVRTRQVIIDRLLQVEDVAGIHCIKGCSFLESRISPQMNKNNQSCQPPPTTYYLTIKTLCQSATQLADLNVETLTLIILVVKGRHTHYMTLFPDITIYLCHHLQQTMPSAMLMLPIPSSSMKLSSTRGSIYMPCQGWTVGRILSSFTL